MSMETQQFLERNMRFAVVILVFGLVTGAPIVPTSVMSKAEAQAATSVSAEERQLQAQLTALAQAGNTDGIKALIAQKIRQGKAGMVAKVAKAIAASGASLAGTDPTNAAALVNAAITIASDASVIAADITITSTVATYAGYAVSTMWDASGATANVSNGQTNVISNNPTMLAAMNSIVNAVNASSNSSLWVSVYTSAPPGGKQALDSNRPQGNQQTGSTQTANNNQQQNNNQQTVIVVPPRPTTPDTPEVPVIIEPNPDQAGSPT